MGNSLIKLIQCNRASPNTKKNRTRSYKLILKYLKHNNQY